MIEYKKIIDDLEGCIALLTQENDAIKKPNEAVNRISFSIALLKKALLSMKAEPHMLSLEEVLTLPRNTDVWIEDRRQVNNSIELYAVTSLYGNSFEITFYGKKSFPTALYGKWWRLWTARPTEVQRGLKPWNG